MRRIETHPWWEDLVALKDAMSLRELGEHFSVTPAAISAAFKRQGITRRPAPSGPREARRRRETPARDGTELRPRSRDADIEVHRDKLGRVPDREVADLVGVHVRTIASYRARHQIPPFRGARGGATHRAEQARLDAFRALVGRLPDRVVAERAGTTIQAVRAYRRRESIPSVLGQGRPLPEDLLSLPHDGEGLDTLGVWRVAFATATGETVRAVVAPSELEAVSLAAGAGLGTVLQVSWVGELLSSSGRPPEP